MVAAIIFGVIVVAFGCIAPFMKDGDREHRYDVEPDSDGKDDKA